MSPLTGLSVADTIGSVATALRSTRDVPSIRGMVVWERFSDGPLDYTTPNHHTLSLYQRGGTKTWSVEARQYGFSDAICFLPEGYNTRWVHRGHVRNLHLYFTNADIEALNWSPAKDPAPKIFLRNAVLRNLGTVLAGDLDWTDPGDRLAVDHLVLALLSQISRGEQTIARGLDTRRLAKIEARLAQLEDGPASVSDLAAGLGMSPRNLSRLYKATTGRTLTDRLREIQISRAKDLLIGDLPLSEIALACGFGSQSHFSSVFRSRSGMTPGTYRRQRR